MIEEQGVVVRFKTEQVALVSCIKTSACDNCASSKLCSLGRDDGKRLVEVHNKLGAKVGDRVKIATTTNAFYKSSFLIYILPLFFLLIGAGLGQWIGKSFMPGIDPNITSCLLGVLFLAGTFVGIRFGTRHLPQEDYMPSIVDILPEEGAETPHTDHSVDLSHGY